jgi:pyruvate dehydrogenase E2 component (dihydrolipoamide acetyltransferase)
MPINITMPALSPTMEEGNLAKWLVKEGDKVAPGDVIAEIETDKATMEVEAVDEGIVAKLVVAAGTDAVKVNALIAILAAEGEDVAEAAKGGNATPAPSQAKAEAPKEEKSEAAPVKAEKPVADQAAAASTPAPVAKSGERIFASPLARRLAKEAGLDLTAVSGSGPHGRIVKTDVEKAAASGGAKAAPAAAASAGAPVAALAKGPSEEAVLKLFEPGSYELVPHDGMRKVIAKRLVESKQTVPHFYVSVDCELDTLLALRAQLNAAAPEKDGKPAYKLSVNDFVLKALALALQRIPDANVSWTDGAMLKHKHSDIGVAVALPGGLITPIVRQAESKSLSTISNEMKDLASRARARKLKPMEYQGGTSAVSNLGMYGIKDFTAVINPPHATILAVGAGEERAVVKNGKIEAAHIMSVTLSCDHRAVDGALGAELIGAFKTLIENPVMMVV